MDIVNNKINEAMSHDDARMAKERQGDAAASGSGGSEAPQEPRPSRGGSHPASSAEAWDKRSTLHPMDAMRYEGGSGDGSNVSGYRDWTQRASPMREDGKRTSPQQYSVEARMNASSSAGGEEAQGSISSTGSRPTSRSPITYQRDRGAPSPMVSEGYNAVNSPRSAYTESRLQNTVSEGPSRVRSPRYSQADTSSSNNADSSMPQSLHIPAPGARTINGPHRHQMPVSSTVNRPRETRRGEDGASSRHSADSPDSDKLTIEESERPPSQTMQANRYSPGTAPEVPGGAVSTSSQGDRGRSAARDDTQPHTTSISPQPSDGHERARHVDNTHYNRYRPSSDASASSSTQPHSDSSTNPPTSMPPTTYPARYMYSALSMATPTSSVSLTSVTASSVQASSSSVTTSTVTTSSQPADSMPHYETLSDDDD